MLSFLSLKGKQAWSTRFGPDGLHRTKRNYFLWWRLRIISWHWLFISKEMMADQQQEKALMKNLYAVFWIIVVQVIRGMFRSETPGAHSLELEGISYGFGF